MQEPKKHHYLPEFYTGAWCEKGKLIRYVNRNGTIHTRSFTPGQVGYRKDLYRLSPAFEDGTAIERHHFERIDNAAAPVFARMNHDASPIFTQNDKEVVALFLLSMPARHPWNIAKAQKLARDGGAIKYDRESAAVLFGADSQATVDQYFLSDFTLHTLVEASTMASIVDRLIRMHWNVWDVSDSPFDLVVADRAFSGRGDLRQDHSQNMVALPVGPHRYLTCSAVQHYPTNSRNMAMIMNRDQTYQAVEHIFARTRNHIPLAKKHLRKIGTWNVLST